MDYLELSIKDVEELSINLAKNIEKNYKPDCIIFVARGSYSIGYELSKYFNCELVEIFARRKGDGLKSKFGFILRILPKNIKLMLRRLEFNSNVHEKNNERVVSIENKEDILINSKNLLIVDDSVDTGHSAKQVHSYIKNKCTGSNVKFAAFNVFEKSKNVYSVDYNLFKDHILIGPWSKDSKYYEEYMNDYKNHKEKKIF